MLPGGKEVGQRPRWVWFVVDRAPGIDTAFGKISLGRDIILGTLPVGTAVSYKNPLTRELDLSKTHLVITSDGYLQIGKYSNGEYKGTTYHPNQLKDMCPSLHRKLKAISRKGSIEF